MHPNTGGSDLLAKQMAISDLLPFLLSEYPGRLQRAEILTTSAALGYAVAAVSPNMEVANVVLPLYVTVLLFFTGLLIRPLDQPAYWHWFSYIDFIHYA